MLPNAGPYYCTRRARAAGKEFVRADKHRGWFAGFCGLNSKRMPTCGAAERGGAWRGRARPREHGDRMLTASACARVQRCASCVAHSVGLRVHGVGGVSLQYNIIHLNMRAWHCSLVQPGVRACRPIFTHQGVHGTHLHAWPRTTRQLGCVHVGCSAAPSSGHKRARRVWTGMCRIPLHNAAARVLQYGPWRAS